MELSVVQLVVAVEWRQIEEARTPFLPRSHEDLTYPLLEHAVLPIHVGAVVMVVPNAAAAFTAMI